MSGGPRREKFVVLALVILLFLPSQLMILNSQYQPNLTTNEDNRPTEVAVSCTVPQSIDAMNNTNNRSVANLIPEDQLNFCEQHNFVNLYDDTPSFRTKNNTRPFQLRGSPFNDTMIDTVKRHLNY
jgi:hypothetical protein